MTTIIVTHENDEVDEHDFEPEIRTITLGRRSTNDVCIPNLSVSGTHAKIMLSDTSAMVEDLNSTNGTYINGRLISRQLLNDGDDIVMGRVRVTFIAAEQSASSASTDHIMLDEPLILTEKPEIQTDLKVDNHTVHAPRRAVPSTSPSVTKAESATLASPEMASFDDSAADLSDADMPVLSPVKEAPATVIDKPRQQTRSTTKVLQKVVHNLDAVAPTHSAVIEIKNGAKSGQVLPIDKPVTTLGRPGIQIAAIMKKPDGYFLMHIESDDNVAPPQLNNTSIGDEPVLLQSGDALNVAGIDVQFMLS